MRNTGSFEDPIDIEEQQEYKRTLEVANQKMNKENVEKILRQPMDGKFEVTKATILSELPGSLEQRQAKVIRRVDKFFKPKDKTINPESEYFRERREANYSVENAYPKRNELLIFGIDFLGVKQIRRLFRNFKTQIKSVDDSHYKIIFKNQEQAKQGLQSYLLDQPVTKIQEEGGESHIPLGWLQLQPYKYQTYQRRLWARYVASYENDKFIEQSNSDHKMKEAKKLYEESLNMENKEIKKLDLMNRLPSLRNRNQNKRQRYQDRDRDRRGRYHREDHFYNQRRHKNYENMDQNNNFQREDQKRRSRRIEEESNRSRQKNREQNSINLSVYSNPKSNQNQISRRISSDQNFEALLDNSYQFHNQNLNDISMNDSFSRVKEEEKNNNESLLSINRSMKKNKNKIQPIEIED